MRLSSYFLPILKETPAEASIASHRLMLRAGMIDQNAAGIYTWLPLGEKILMKLDKIIHEEQEKIDCYRMIMPTIQQAKLWQESGRYDDYGLEMLRMVDRHDREMLYGPTHEEVVTDIMRKHLTSYKQLPKRVFQIHWKFRDEIRPRFGIMRGREFYMKDAYSLDEDKERAEATYNDFYDCYLRTFKRMGLDVIPLQADPGAIGGDLSHEFHVVAETGESAIFFDKNILKVSNENWNRQGLAPFYATAEETHDPKNCPVKEEDLIQKRGIEVGHIFYFGTKYSQSMGLHLAGPNDTKITPHMGSYGIGVGRLVPAIIEAFHDEQGIIWPKQVAPFMVGLLNICPKKENVTTYCNDLYTTLHNAGIDTLYDDRDERPGVKFATQDLIGTPYQVIIGEKCLEKGEIEVKDRATGERQYMTQDALLNMLKAC